MGIRRCRQRVASERHSRRWGTPSLPLSRVVLKINPGASVSANQGLLCKMETRIRVGMPAPRGSNGAIQMAWFNGPIT